MNASLPELILEHARIYTVASARPWAEAVAIAGGKIVAVGSDAHVVMTLVGGKIVYENN